MSEAYPDHSEEVVADGVQYLVEYDQEVGQTPLPYPEDQAASRDAAFSYYYILRYLLANKRYVYSNSINK